MPYHVAMGTKLTADYPLQKTESGYRFQGADKKMPLRKKLEGGTLVKASIPYGDDWKPVDTFKPATHQELKEEYGVWRDRGWIFRNGKIDEGEVTPLRDIYRPLEKLGYAGGGVTQVKLMGRVDGSELDHYLGTPTLSLDSHVARKSYQFHHDAGPFADLYYNEDRRRDEEALRSSDARL